MPDQSVGEYAICGIGGCRDSDRVAQQSCSCTIRRVDKSRNETKKHAERRPERDPGAACLGRHVGPDGLFEELLGAVPQRIGSTRTGGLSVCNRTIRISPARRTSTGANKYIWLARSSRKLTLATQHASNVHQTEIQMMSTEPNRSGASATTTTAR
jgi:hypothetical protein